MSEIVLPRLGWNMEQGVFLGWLKKDGDRVAVGEPLFSVEGDKAVQEIEAVEAGVLRIAATGPKDGDTVPVGTIIGHLETSASVPKPPPPASPSVRRLAREMGVDLAAVVGNGPGGRVDADDVRAHQGRRNNATPRARKAAREAGVDVANLTGTGRDGRVRACDVPAAPAKAASNTRQTIAQRMVHSLRSTAPVTLTTTADATNLAALREQFKAIDGTAPSFTDLFVKLTALALMKHPDLNARWQDDRVVASPDVHVGVAVDTEGGLLVPVIRSVPALGVRQLAAESKRLIEKARARKLTADEMQGGTFTVTNLGAFGIDAFTPIINWPECAILGIGRIQKTPVVRDGQIVARDVVTLSLTFDHRIADGAPAARFLAALVKGVENPAAVLVG